MIHPTLGQWLSPYVVTRNNCPKVDMMSADGGLNQSSTNISRCDSVENLRCCGPHVTCRNLVPCSLILHSCPPRPRESENSRGNVCYNVSLQGGGSRRGNHYEQIIRIELPFDHSPLT
jgi:hypothetical protein